MSDPRLDREPGEVAVHAAVLGATADLLATVSSPIDHLSEAAELLHALAAPRGTDTRQR